MRCPRRVDNHAGSIEVMYIEAGPINVKDDEACRQVDSENEKNNTGVKTCVIKMIS